MKIYVVFFESGISDEVSAKDVFEAKKIAERRHPDKKIKTISLLRNRVQIQLP